MIFETRKRHRLLKMYVQAFNANLFFKQIVQTQKSRLPQNYPYALEDKK